jgi:GTP 3',8-cyclase
LRSINVSLDSLRPQRFTELTRRGQLAPVLSAIRAARQRGFSVKVNCVIFKGVNDDEWPEFIHLAESEDIEVRFLELMKVGPGYWNHEERFVPADHMLEKIQRLTQITPIQVSEDSTSFVFSTMGGGKIGFIASESKPFCNHCSRLRLTAQGQLRACLFSENGIALKGASAESYPALLKQLMPMKPTYRLDHIHQPMNQIGG